MCNVFIAHACTHKKFFWKALLLELGLLFFYEMCGSEWHPIFQLWCNSRQPARTEGTRRTISVNWLTWRLGGSVQCDNMFLLKPPGLSLPLLFSLGLLIVMFSLPALLSFSLIKFKEWLNCWVRVICKAQTKWASLLYSLISTCHRPGARFNTK